MGAQIEPVASMSERSNTSAYTVISLEHEDVLAGELQGSRETRDATADDHDGSMSGHCGLALVGDVMVRRHGCAVSGAVKGASSPT